VHRQSLLCRVLFVGHSTKLFAECQRALDKEKWPLRRRVTETVALPSVSCDTRQRNRQGGSPCQVLCRVSLPSASDITLGKEPKPVSKSVLFAECYDPDTRQSDQYIPFYLFFVFHPHKQKISHIYITDINSQHKHKYPSQT
jgi:hypothetical protein